jgi:hypothetical protein
MSEAELHFLKQRLSQARLNKARRGELFTKVPTGYIRLPADRIALDPDEQVQLVVRLIFDKFDELGSVYAVLRYLVRHEIKLGMRVQSGPEAGRLEWHRPIHGTLNTIIRHPFYAGCYAFGFSAARSASERSPAFLIPVRSSRTAEVGGDDPGQGRPTSPGTDIV